MFSQILEISQLRIMKAVSLKLKISTVWGLKYEILHLQKHGRSRQNVRCRTHFQVSRFRSHCNEIRTIFLYDNRTT